MGPEKGQAHRPGVFKQTNKAHKHGNHRSKSEVKAANQGKVSVKNLSRKSKTELNRQERRNQAVQIRQIKRNETLSKKRSLGGLDHAPFLVCLVPLNQTTSTTAALEILMQCDSEAIITKSPTGVTHICTPRFKQKFAIISPSTDNEFSMLDALKVADTAVFLVSVSGGVDENVVDKLGQNLLMTSFSQGLPTPVIALTDFDTVNPKKKQECKQHIQKSISKWFPDEKLMMLENSSDGINVLRKIGGHKKKQVIYRDRRPHILAENVEFIPNKGCNGTLKVTGYLRGSALSVNGLVHLPGIGDFQMEQIDAPYDPYSVDKQRNKEGSAPEGVRVLDRSDVSRQESLDSENVPDLMDMEQTWPTEEELKTADKVIKGRIKGWSDYQAAWIPDEDQFLDDEDSESDNEFMDAASEIASDDEPKEFDQVTESEVGANHDKYDEEMDFCEEKQALLKMQDAKSDRMFPDEVDTPQNETAKVRFQKYRGLESFRTSPWDPNECLPMDYGRIFRFDNFDRTKMAVLQDQKDLDGANPGWYITVHIKDVPESAWSSFEQLKFPLIVFGLLPLEHKMSILNVVLKRTPNSSLPIKSKEKLIFQCGYRRFVANPIFSEHTNGEKHKFERFFQPEATSVATFYGRIQFPPSPVLCYKEQNGQLILVATGKLISCNADRIILKRIVLSGHPFKIHKKSAVIRFMFFNREDIVHFKPVKLRTKMGRIGHIKEPLGTHGHMKCIFNGQLNSQDTVLMSLYKRVFPKWTYEDLVVTLSNDNVMET